MIAQPRKPSKSDRGFVVLAGLVVVRALLVFVGLVRLADLPDRVHHVLALRHRDSEAGLRERLGGLVLLILSVIIGHTGSLGTWASSLNHQCDRLERDDVGMENMRPTRWQKARADWPGFQLRDIGGGAIGLALAVVGLVVFGRPGEAVTEVLIVGGAAILAAVLYALGQLVWAWLQAPMRLLTADVIAIRECVEAAPATSAPAGPPFNMRLSLLNSTRLGEELRQHARSGGMTRKSHEEWVTPVVQLLHEHAAQEDAELFLRQRSLNEQLQVLEQLLGKYPR